MTIDDCGHDQLGQVMMVTKQQNVRKSTQYGHNLIDSN